MKTCIAASRMNCFAWSVQMAGTVRTHKMSSDQEDLFFSVTFGAENFACVCLYNLLSHFLLTNLNFQFCLLRKMNCSRTDHHFFWVLNFLISKSSKWFYRYLIASANTFKAGSLFPFSAINLKFFNLCPDICNEKIQINQWRQLSINHYFELDSFNETW